MSEVGAVPSDAPVRVVPVSEAPWDHVRTVFGTSGDPSTCFCQYFKVDAAVWKAHPAPPDPACSPTSAAGWAAVEPRPAYPRTLRGGAALGSAEADHDAPEVWAITRFVVRVGYRRRGVGAALLRGAVEEARRGEAVPAWWRRTRSTPPATK